MKKLFPILAVLVLISTACQLGGGQAQPTPIAVATAIPTSTSIPLNATAAPSGNQTAGSARNSVDGMTEVYIPAGAFQMGGVDPNASDVEKPVHQVTMPSFWIDKFDVTNAMYLGCVNKGVCTPPQAITSKTRTSYFNDPNYNDYPVIEVTWSQADAYCKWAAAICPLKLSGSMRDAAKPSIPIHGATSRPIALSQISTIRSRTRVRWAAIRQVLVRLVFWIWPAMWPNG